MTPAQTYLAECQRLIHVVQNQTTEIARAADWFADAILAGGMVHLFGSGHSRIMVEEMWPRYGSFPGFHPMVELSLTHHHSVVGSNGQRQAMFLENVPGLAQQVLRNFGFRKTDAALIISSSGANVVPIEMAEGFRKHGLRTVALISKDHAKQSTSRHRNGIMLADVADLVLDTGAPPGDAMVHVAGLATPVAPGSTVGGCMVVNAIKAEVADRLTKAGHPPTVLTAPCLVGEQQSRRLFESAYDEHSQRMVQLYSHPGETHD